MVPTKEAETGNKGGDRKAAYVATQHTFHIDLKNFHKKEKAMSVSRFFRNCSRFIRREEGQTLSEYALILVLIAVVAIVAIALLGNQITAVLNSIAAAL